MQLVLVVYDLDILRGTDSVREVSTKVMEHIADLSTRGRLDMFLDRLQNATTQL